MKPILDGALFSKTIEDWTVIWESCGAYRHWCEQRETQNSGSIIVVMQNPGMLSDYTAVAKPIFDQMLCNQQQNQQLTELRDWLLPMLMNGQITVD